MAHHHHHGGPPPYGPPSHNYPPCGHTQPHQHFGYYWKEMSIGQHMPRNAVQGGIDSDGSPIFVGLACYQGNEVPCKVVPRRTEALIGWDGKEVPVTHFKVLCDDHARIRWVRSSHGNVPHDAIPAGRTNKGETLYIGRAKHHNAEIVGKIHPSYKCMFLPYGGKEHTYKEYEVLVAQL